jgi:hypothetical protein
MDNGEKTRPDGMPVGKPFTAEYQPEGRGRPKGSVDIMRLVQSLLEDNDNLPAALRKVIEERCGMGRRAIEAVFLSLLLEALQGDTKAASELLNRGYGKVADKIEGGDPDNPVQVDNTLRVVVVNPKGSSDE